MRRKIITSISIIAVVIAIILTGMLGSMMKKKELQMEKDLMKTIVTQVTDNIRANSGLDVESREEMISRIMSSIPTKRSRTLFAMDETNGKIIGISRNNKQTLEMENSVKQLKTAIENPVILTINGEKQLVLVQECNGVLVGYLSTVKEIYKNVEVYMFRIAILVISLFVIIIICLYFILDMLILKDIEQMYAKARQYIDGKRDVQFLEGKTKEIGELSEILNKVIQVIETKGHRISTVATMLGKGFEAYEYYADLNQIFYSENLPQMMGMSPKECENQIINQFLRVKRRGVEKDIFEEEEIQNTKTGRTLKIRRIFFKNASYAFLEDVTEERENKKELERIIEVEKEKSYQDVLTGLYNRRKVKEYVNYLLKHKENPEGILLLMDLDNFKAVNDQFGHLEGDILLKKFADLLNVQFCNSDLKVRMGGDEFVVFMPIHMENEILTRRIKDFLEEVHKALNYYYIKFKLSVSVGVAEINEATLNFEDLYSSADEAMYMAKRNGKDSFYIN